MDFRHPGHMAFVLFTRTREEEARAKDFSATHSLRTNSLIAGHLIGHAERTARNTGLPCFVISSAQQHGNSSGEKLAHAFEDIYSLGYTQVIAIGNDCPTLTTNDLLEAATALNAHGAVMGPANDGGVYLIGLHRKHFDRLYFEKLPWSSDNLFVSLTEYFSVNGISFASSRALSDIDYPTALQQVLKGTQLSTSLRFILISLLAGLHALINKDQTNPTLSQLRMYVGLRAPPVF